MSPSDENNRQSAVKPHKLSGQTFCASCTPGVLRQAEQSEAAKANPRLKKIRIRIPPEDGWETESEWLWAEQVAENVFALRNIPYYRYGVSFDDHVRVDKIEGFLEMVGVAHHCGHSTYRLFSKQGFESPKAQQTLAELVENGCDLEWNTRFHLAVDVQPEADIHKVYERMTQARKAGIFEFEEGHCGHSAKKK